MAENFLKIADAWEVGGKHGVGPVVASPDSFYLVLNVATFFDINIGGVIGCKATTIPPGNRQLEFPALGVGCRPGGLAASDN